MAASVRPPLLLVAALGWHCSYDFDDGFRATTAAPGSGSGPTSAGIGPGSGAGIGGGSNGTAGGGDGPSAGGGGAGGALPVEDCANGIDDDGNGARDCVDAVCASLPACVGTCAPGSAIVPLGTSTAYGARIAVGPTFVAWLRSNDYVFDNGGWGGNAYYQGVIDGVDVGGSIAGTLFSGANFSPYQAPLLHVTNDGIQYALGPAPSGSPSLGVTLLRRTLSGTSPEAFLTPSDGGYVIQAFLERGRLVWGEQGGTTIWYGAPVDDPNDRTVLAVPTSFVPEQVTVDAFVGRGASTADTTTMVRVPLDGSPAVETPIDTPLRALRVAGPYAVGPATVATSAENLYRAGRGPTALVAQSQGPISAFDVGAGVAVYADFQSLSIVRASIDDPNPSAAATLATGFSAYAVTIDAPRNCVYWVNYTAQLVERGPLF